MSNSEKGKKIAKNTILLYFRMLISMAVSLYTSRIVLSVLGVVDLGVYNITGGVVTMFSFLNSAMATGTQRFLSFEIGKKNMKQLSKVFNMSINIHVLIAVVIFIISETIGIWFLNSYLVIPTERIEAANWVFQFSVLASIVSVLSVPYNAIIIAHERINVYAYVSLIDVGLKLVIVFMLQWFGFDKLKLYAILIFIVTLIIRFIYGVYSKIYFSECKYNFFWDKALFKNMMSYNGWNLFGNLSSVMYNQGVNILLNVFFGPVVNAARGLTYQLNTAVYSFVSNLQMAMNPQIVKSYASNDLKFMHRLIFRGAKYSFFLLLLVTLPVLVETDMVLSIWLKTAPDYTIIFTKLILINSLIGSLSGTLGTAVLASGDIKKYHLVVGGLQLLNLPFSYLFLYLGYPPEATFYISIVISIITFFSRLLITAPLISLSIKSYVKDVLFPVLYVTLISIIFPFLVKYNFNQDIFRFIIVCIISVLSLFTSVYLVGFNNEEKFFLKTKAFQVLSKLRK